MIYDRYIPVESKWLSPEEVRVCSCTLARHMRYTPSIGSLLSQWSSFASIDEVVCELVKLPSLTRIAQEFAARSRPAGNLPIRSLGRILSALALVQQHSLSRRVDVQHFKALLEQMALSGILVSESRLLQSCRAPSQVRTTKEIRTIGVLCNTDAGSRSPTSSQVPGLQALWDEGRISIGRIWPSAWKQRPHTSVAHARSSARSEYLKCIVKQSGVDEDLAAFALMGDSRVSGVEGAHANYLLLNAGGEPLMLLNSVPLVPPGASAVPTHVPLIFDESTRLLGGVSCEQRTFEAVLGLHERTLGRSPSELAADYIVSDSVKFISVCNHMAGALQLGTGRIVLTAAGPIVDVPRGLRQFVRVDSCKRITAPAVRPWMTQLHSGRNICASPGITLSHDFGVPLNCFSVDCSEMVPPFPPCGGGGDRVFSRLISLCYPQGFAAHLPWHLQYDHACRSGTPLSWDVGDLLLCCIEHIASSYSDLDPCTSLQVGRELTAVGRMTRKEFLHFIRLCISELSSVQLRAWNVFRSSHTGNVESSSVLSRWFESWERALGSPSSWMPEELLRTARDTDTAAEILQSVFAKYGRLLVIWPELFSLCNKHNSLEI